jgi:peroxiredoxin Q/BCP
MYLRLLLLVICLTSLLLGGASCSMPTHEQQAAANEVYLHKEGIVALQPGAAAPELSGATLATGEAVELQQLAQQHPGGLILFAFPALDAPNSLRNLRDWEKRSQRLAEHSIGVYGLAPAPAETVMQWQAARGIRLPLLADPSGSTARAWGCLGPEASLPQRTTIGVGPEGSVVFFYRGSAPDQTVNSAFRLNGK